MSLLIENNRNDRLHDALACHWLDKEKELEKAKLTEWRNQLNRAKALAGKSERRDSIKSLLETMGSTAQEEWGRLEHAQMAKAESWRMSGEESEKYNPSSYLLCSIGICVASVFVKYHVPNASELDARLNLIEDAINRAEKTSPTFEPGRAACKF